MPEFLQHISLEDEAQVLEIARGNFDRWSYFMSLGSSNNVDAYLGIILGRTWRGNRPNGLKQCLRAAFGLLEFEIEQGRRQLARALDND